MTFTGLATFWTFSECSPNNTTWVLYYSNTHKKVRKKGIKNNSGLKGYFILRAKLLKC